MFYYIALGLIGLSFSSLLSYLITYFEITWLINLLIYFAVLVGTFVALIVAENQEGTLQIQITALIVFFVYYLGGFLQAIAQGRNIEAIIVATVVVCLGVFICAVMVRGLMAGGES